MTDDLSQPAIPAAAVVDPDAPTPTQGPLPGYSNEDIKKYMDFHNHDGISSQKISYNNLLDQPTFTTNPSLTTGESLLAGEPVYMDLIDQKLYQSHGYKAANFGNSFSWSGTNPIRRVTKLSTSYYMQLGYNGATLTLYVGNSSSGANITSSSLSTHFSGSSATVVMLSDTTFIAFFSSTLGGGGAQLYFRTGSFNGSTITLDTETVFTDPNGQSINTPTLFFAQPGIINGSVFLADMTGPNGSGGTLFINLRKITASTNTATQNSVATTTVSSGAFSAAGYWNTVCVCSNGSAYSLFSYSDGSNNYFLRAHYIGTSASASGMAILSQDAGGNNSSRQAATPMSLVGHNGNAYWAYVINAGTNFTANYVLNEITPNGQGRYIPLMAVQAGQQNPTNGPLFMAGNDRGIVIWNVGEPSEQTILYFQNGQIYGIGAVMSSVPDYLDAWYMQTRDTMLNINGTAVYQSYIPTEILGYVASAASSGASAVLSFDPTIVTSVTLTAGKIYYLKDTWVSTRFGPEGSIPAGRALTSSLLLRK